MNKLIIPAIIIYILSAIGMYFWFRIAFYHRKGIQRYLTIDTKSAYLFTFLPVFNTICLFMYWGCVFPIKYKTIKLPNIFKPRKK